MMGDKCFSSHQGGRERSSLWDLFDYVATSKGKVPDFQTADNFDVYLMIFI